MSADLPESLKTSALRAGAAAGTELSQEATSPDVSTLQVV